MLLHFCAPRANAVIRIARSTHFSALIAVFGAACADSTAPLVGHPDLVLSDLSTMQVGAVRDLTLSQASAGLQIPGSPDGTEYAFTITNVAVNNGGSAQSFSASGILGAPGPVGTSGDLVAPRSFTRADAAVNTASNTVVNSFGAQFESRLREIERTGLPDRSATLMQRGTHASASLSIPLPARSAAPAVGSTMSVRVLTPSGFTGENSRTCSSKGFITTTGQVRAVGVHAIVVSDVTSPAGGFTDADFQSIADEFDNLIYPTDVAYFGTPTDLDGNGHVILYYTPAVNRLTPAGQAAVNGYIGGFFFAGDLFPATGASACASSNAGEIFYLFTPDPQGTQGNAFATTAVRYATRGTIAHELQHMINSGNRHASATATEFEATWLDEGLAHFAEDAVGRVAAGFSDTKLVGSFELSLVPDSTIQAYFTQNLTRTKYYVLRTDTTGPIVNRSRAAADLAARGAEWTLVRYAADWFANGDPRTLTRKLVAGPDTGLVNFTKAAGVSVDTLLKRWSVTMLTDHTNIPHLDPLYNFKSYRIRQLVTNTFLNEGTALGAYIPLPPIDAAHSPFKLVIPSSSANYFDFSTDANAAETITFSLVDPNERVYVVRVQ